VKVYSASGAPKFLAKGQFDKPSAVVVVEQGRTFAVKDDSAIAFFDLRTDGAAVRVIDRLHRPIGQLFLFFCRRTDKVFKCSTSTALNRSVQDWRWTVAADW
jgi:hypothetical protein